MYWIVEWKLQGGKPDDYFHGIVKTNKSNTAKILYHFQDSNKWKDKDYFFFTSITSVHRKVINLEEYIDVENIPENEIVDAVKEKIPEYFI